MLSSGWCLILCEVLTVDKKADDSKRSYNFVQWLKPRRLLALILYAQLNDFAKLLKRLKTGDWKWLPDEDSHAY